MKKKLNYKFGLTSRQVAERLASDGYNELAKAKKKSLTTLFFNIASEPMILLILICSWLYIALGDKQEALALLFSIVLVIIIELMQEAKTERALEALKDLSSPRALVIRDGKRIRIAGREVVQGDIVVLAEGDRVPADGMVVESNNLQIDESILTGESVPVSKIAGRNIEDLPRAGGNNTPYVYASTLVVDGHGLIMVLATGRKTQVGKIGESLNKIKTEKTKLQTEVGSLVKIIGSVGGVLCVIIFLAYGIINRDWLNGLLYGLSLAMSILPQEFPVILVIFLAMGAWRMSRHKVLARQQKVIQSLGSVTVLCVDKTGTLTMNKQQLEEIADLKYDWVNSSQTLNDTLRQHLVVAKLASRPESADPLEEEIITIAKKHPHESSLDKYYISLVKEFPLTRQLLAVTRVWQAKDETLLVTTKGAPEAVLAMCHMDHKIREQWQMRFEEMAGRGLRVLAVASLKLASKKVPTKLADLELTMSCLLGFIDPVRPGVKEAVAECKKAGIRVVMVTGDYPATARHIAGQIGLGYECGVMTGEELERLSPIALRDALKDIAVFARVAPEHKFKIVEAYKGAREIVAMTGDGVNDAPALKTAHVGVAMGARGTDVARESAGIVLLDDEFNSIVRGVRQGRRIFDNIRKAMMYVLSFHLSVASLTLMSVLLNWPLVLLPLHLAFMELIVDPVSSVAFEAEPDEHNIMNRPPRPTAEKILNGRSVRLAVLQGLWLLLTIIVVFKYSFMRQWPTDVIRSMVFVTMIFGNLGLIIANRSSSRPFWLVGHTNYALRWVLSGALVMLCLVFFTPARGLFKLAYLDWQVSLSCVAAGLTVIIWSELWKMLVKRFDIRQ